MVRFRALNAALLLLVLPVPAHSQSPASAATVLLDKAEAAMLGRPRDVIKATHEARPIVEAVTEAATRDQLLARLLWLEGEAKGRLGDLNSADRSLATAARFAERSAQRTVLHGMIMLAQGSTRFDAGDTQAAFSHFRNAFEIFTANGNTRGQALALQSIGTIYIDAGDYARVLRYYAQSAEVHSDDDRLALSAFNNQALAYKELGRLTEAERDYRRALDLAVELRSPSTQARILTNLAGVELAQGKFAAAEVTVQKGLKLAIGDAAEWAPFLWGVRAQIALQNGRPGTAVALLPRIFAGVPLERTTYLYRDAHATASDALLAIGDARGAFEHLRALNRLDERAREIRSSANSAMLAQQFDSANQELRIARRDAALAEARARAQWLLLGAAALLLIAAAGAFAWITRSRNETRRINVQLNKALAAKSEFLATTSHEIRTPLNGIMGMTQVLLRAPGVATDLRERISVIDGAGKAMKAIVDDLLDMAKIEAGEVSICREPTDLHALMHETVSLWTAAAEAKGLSISAEPGAVPRRIVEDERKLRQILFNLVSNAVKFTTAGSIVLAARAEGGRLLLSVADTGRGIPADQCDDIFKAFHQIDSATTRQQSGTGLGLAISAKLAEALDGGISVQSTLDVGSEFTVDLPLRVDHAAELPPELIDAPLSLATARVLLVDANPLFQSMVRAALGKSIGRLICANSYSEACGQGVCDVLLVDQMTLGDECLEVLRVATQARTVIMLVPPNGFPTSMRNAVEKHLPPRGLLPAVTRAVAELEPLRLAC